MYKKVKFYEFRIKGSFGTMYLQARNKGLMFLQEVELPIRPWNNTCVKPTDIIYFLFNLRESWSLNDQEFENASLLIAQRLRYFSAPESMQEEKFNFEDWISSSRNDFYCLGDDELFDLKCSRLKETFA